MIKIRPILRALRYPVIALLAYGLYVVALQATGNYHEVVQGELYRSAQPTNAELARYATRDGIRSVLNLRGEHKGEAWYDDEVRISNENHVKHLDYKMGARRELTKEEALKLIRMMKGAPKPLLVHCRSGADRSGLVAALYMVAVKKLPEEEAASQLSLRYGHVWFAKERAMDQSLKTLVPALGLNQAAVKPTPATN